MIELREYASKVAEASAPSQKVEARLRQLLGKKLELRWLSGDRVEIRATSWVGVVELPENLTVRVRPKLTGD